ncbi:glutaredoxin family protein [Brachybacterium sp. JHP9]|uniref:Glutaredoxin family protein n=1 Tax=Brachybacterium equifaecis TaxID=2910770 RepID=A0ABT0QZ23_9MICO|nr:glutaredoxin family protein [Brachybacterium equifaecis]
MTTPADLPAPPQPRDPDARIVYLTREGCHLCDVALPTVRAEADRAGTVVEVRDIDAEPALREDWNDHVPVIAVDGAVLSRYEVDADELRRALARGAVRGRGGARPATWLGRLLRR